MFGSDALRKLGPQTGRDDPIGWDKHPRKDAVTTTIDKPVLTLEEIESQTALELPDRELMALVNVIVTDVLNHNKVGVSVCANVGVAALNGGNANFTGTNDCPVGPQ
jgi:hypothetical protein